MNEKYEQLLTIVLPTYNHPTYIEYYLEKADYLDKFNIILEVHDSSTNDETEQIVSKYASKYKNLKYIKYPDIHVDIKTILSLSKVKTKYAFLCGDGVILNANENYSTIYKYLKDDVDIVELYDDAVPKNYEYFLELSKDNHSDVMEYNSLLEHFNDNLWHMPYYGGSIVKSCVFAQRDEENMKEVIGSGFVYPYMIYDYNYKDFNAIVLGGNYHISNIYKTTSIWLKTEKRAMELWANNFPLTINKITTIPDKEKEDGIRRAEHVLNLFSKKYLILFRLNGNYDLKKYRKYKEQIKKYSGQPTSILVGVAICPKFVIKLAYFIIKRRRWKDQ